MNQMLDRLPGIFIYGKQGESMKRKRNLMILNTLFFLISWLTITLIADKVWAEEREELNSIIQTLRESRNRDISYMGIKIVVNYSSCQPDVKSIQIIHGPANKEKREIFSLKEKKTQVILDDGQHIWHYIPSEAFVIRKNSYVFEDVVKDLKEKEQLIEQNYKIYIEKQGQIINRNSIGIFFEPKDANRPARKIWVDREYGIPLRTEIYDLSGNLILLSTFSEIKFGSVLGNDIFSLKIPEGIPVKTFVEARYDNLAEAEKHINFKLHPLGYIPEGFTLTGITHIKVDKGERVHLLYSDGLSSLSIFQDRSVLSLSGTPLPTREVDINDKKGVLYDQGLLKILNWKLQDIYVTLIGEISEDELLKVARSILP